MRSTFLGKRFATGAAPVLSAGLLLLAVPATASADCSKDIDKVEYAVDHSQREGIDVTVAERMRALLEEANKARKAGDEKTCQKLIDQAKYMGNVD